MSSQDTNFRKANLDMVLGYYDGHSDDRNDLPKQHNYSPSYVHGWLNGRDDRIGKPRDAASVLRARADLIMENDQ